MAQEALTWLGVDAAGFDEMDRKILLTVIEKFGGGPVGVESLAAAVQEDRSTLEDVYEPYLIQAGFLERTGRGRQVDQAALDHFRRPTRSPVLTPPVAPGDQYKAAIHLPRKVHASS